MPVRPYEIVYIIDPDVNAEDSGALVERFRALAEAQGAADLRVDTQLLGRRRLAYEINHKREGQYVVMNFQSEANAPAEVDRVLRITDGVLRSMVIRLDEMPPEPAQPAPVAAPPAAAPAPEASAPPASDAAPAPEGTEADVAPAAETPDETPVAQAPDETPVAEVTDAAPAAEVTDEAPASQGDAETAS